MSMRSGTQTTRSERSASARSARSARWRRMSSRVLSCLLVAFVAGAVGCRKVETAFDCQVVCAKYRECFDANYDVGACRARCAQRASAEPHLRKKADACESCIRGHSCMGATFEC